MQFFSVCFALFSACVSNVQCALKSNNICYHMSDCFKLIDLVMIEDDWLIVMNF